jgi:AraC-like DNA-binding protein
MALKSTSSNVGQPSVQLRFFMPSQALAPYVTTIYHMEIEPAGDAPLVDYLHPEWGNIRITNYADLEAGIGEEPLRVVPPFVATGPTSLTTKFSIRGGRSWGIGLLPLGWLKFVDAPAGSHADRFCDASGDPAFAAFEPLTDQLFTSGPDLADEAQIIEDHVISLITAEGDEDEMVTRVHSALVDTNLSAVSELVEASGMQIRTLERFSKRVFGFPPKLLLRRQRFLRSLSQFMLDPSLSWLKTLDYQYHDQAHFVRDFRRFMTMPPNQYRQMDHPILMAAVRGRMEAAGEAVQALHDPQQRNPD